MQHESLQNAETKRGEKTNSWSGTEISVRICSVNGPQPDQISQMEYFQIVDGQRRIISHTPLDQSLCVFIASQIEYAFIYAQDELPQDMVSYFPWLYSNSQLPTSLTLKHLFFIKPMNNVSNHFHFIFTSIYTFSVRCRNFPSKI